MNLIDLFIEQCVLYGYYVDEGISSSKANTACEIFDDVATKLKSGKNLEMLLPLLEHREKWVRIHAAIYCLELDEGKALSVLSYIENNESGFVSINAKYGAREWMSKKGK